MLNCNIRKAYTHYFAAAFGSSCISCIYGIVDMAVVGQYHGPDGTAAMSVVMPIFNIIYSLGLLYGIGGSVLFSTQKGKGQKDSDAVGPNEYFTTSLICSAVTGILLWIILFSFEEPILYLFGADESLLPLAKKYILPIKIGAPVFVFNQMTAAYLRNDNAPGLATLSVVISGIFNVFADFFFVFGLDMGIIGAGIATTLGATVSLVVMCTHFFTKKNTLRLVKVRQIFNKIKRILVTGFSTFFVDLAMGIITILFNRQIMQYLGTNALSVFGILVNIYTFVQCCAYGAGQAAQPIISMNYGAGKASRIKETLKYAIYTVIFFGVLWLALIELFPNAFIHLFMDATEEVLAIAPGIMRRFGLCFLILPFNIFSTYYFQAIMKPATSFAVSVSHGLVISGILIMVLPTLFGGNAVWYAMPITEALVAVYVVVMMVKYTRALKEA